MSFLFFLVIIIVPEYYLIMYSCRHSSTCAISELGFSYFRFETFEMPISNILQLLNKTADDLRTRPSQDSAMINQLPDNVLVNIFKFCVTDRDNPDTILLSARWVCKKWFLLCCDRDIWLDYCPQMRYVGKNKLMSLFDYAFGLRSVWLIVGNETMPGYLSVDEFDRFLSSAKGLEWLTLDCHGISEEYMVLMLISVAESLAKLSYLEISHYSQRRKPSEVFVAFPTIPSLRSLSLHFCGNLVLSTGSFVDICRNYGNLTSLNLAHSTQCTISGMFEIVHNLVQLRDLHLDETSLSDAMLFCVVLKCDNLEELSITYNRFTFVGLDILFSDLAVFRDTLETLTLDEDLYQSHLHAIEGSPLNRRLGAAGALNLIQIDNSYMKRYGSDLEMAYEFDVLSLQISRSIIASACQITELMLDNDYDVDDLVLLAISMKCNKLRALAFSGCVNIRFDVVHCVFSESAAFHSTLRYLRMGATVYNICQEYICRTSLYRRLYNTQSIEIVDDYASYLDLDFDYYFDDSSDDGSYSIDDDDKIESPSYYDKVYIVWPIIAMMLIHVCLLLYLEFVLTDYDDDDDEISDDKYDEYELYKYRLDENCYPIS